MHTPRIALHARHGPCGNARTHRSYKLHASVRCRDAMNGVGKRTSFMPGSTERRFTTSFECNAPGKASQNARARMNLREGALRMTMESEDG